MKGDEMKKYEVYVEHFLGEFKSEAEACNFLDSQGYEEDEDTKTIIREVK